MDWLTFFAICIIIVPWQVLAFIIVWHINRYLDALLNSKNIPVSVTSELYVTLSNYVNTWLNQIQIPNKTTEEAVPIIPRSRLNRVGAWDGVVDSRHTKLI